MDSTVTVGQLSQVLGVSAPTVRRSAAGLGTRTSGGHRRFSSADVAAIARTTGITPAVDGFTRSEVRVLAALSRSPLGLRSARAVARRAGVSPTSAGTALRSLAARGLAASSIETVAEGRAVDVEIWRLVVGDAWFDVAEQVSRTVLPVRPEPAPPRTVPRRFWHLFWSGDPRRLRLPDDAEFVARRMLASSDANAVAWALSRLPTEAIDASARARGSAATDRAMVANEVRSRAFARTPPTDDPGCLNGVFGATKVQFLAVPDQVQLRSPLEVAGMPVGSVEDIFATKLKVIGDRGELRDYFDLMCIERSGRPVEEGLQLFRARYPTSSDESLLHIVRSLGYLDDVSDDPLLRQSAGPDVREQVEAHWRRRQPEIVRALDSRGGDAPGSTPGS